MTSEHERQMQQANERASNARKQATALQSQLSLIQLVLYTFVGTCRFKKIIFGTTVVQKFSRDLYFANFSFPNYSRFLLIRVRLFE